MAASRVVPVGAESWWTEEAIAVDGAAATPSLAGDATADACIVGGGFTGLWTALALREREPSARIVVIEARCCGSGSSGRNGGFLHGYWSSLTTTRATLGAHNALTLARDCDQVIPAVRALPEDVWLHDGGLLMVSTAPSQDRVVDGAVRTADALGVPERAVPLDRTGVAELIDSPVFRRGVFFRDCATVQPARLVQALRRAVLDAGIVLHEWTPAVAIADGQVTTPGGKVYAEVIVVAVNAVATGWRPVRRHVANFGSYVVLTEPVPELLEQIGWTGGEAVRDARTFLHYFRTTDDGRVLMGSATGRVGFGGRLDGRFTHDMRSAARAERGLRRLLPGLARARVERAWGGPIDVSADHLPFFGTVKGTRIHYGLGYSGHGVGPSWLGGQILASLCVGRDDEWTQHPLATRRVPALPPEPLKRLGGGLVRAAIIACEEAEEEGRRPPLAARAAAELPRMLRMQIGTR